ncbi:MAG: gamma-glutamylcyclotransferase [Pseudooceanicola sp.]
MTSWVFGYGSLMWNPEFTPAETVGATLPGFTRSFCMWSIHHRGSVADPGLVLALDEAAGDQCQGVALRMPDTGTEAVLAALRERELVSSAYREQVLPIWLDDGREVEALAYVVDPGHEQYCGGLPIEDQARVIANAYGRRGANREYLWATTEHLESLGIADSDLTYLAQRVRRIVDKSLA